MMSNDKTASDAFGPHSLSEVVEVDIVKREQVIAGESPHSRHCTQSCHITDRLSFRVFPFPAGH